MSQPVFRMHVLAAGHGDCLWVDYGNPSAPTRILVDAGPVGTLSRLRPALHMVRGSTPSHELLVVTHIDADHIGGAIDLLEDQTLASQFKEVWFNGRRQLVQASGMQSLGAVQGERLSAALAGMSDRWNRSMDGAPIMTTSTGALPTYTFGSAQVTVLSPEPAGLTNLLPTWDSEVRAAGLVAASRATTPKPPPPGWQSFGAVNVPALAAMSVAPDAAKANGSSIALLIDFESRRLLLGADAHPDVLLRAIRRISPNVPLKVDVWKVSHHGSAANLTPDLLAAIDTKTIVFSSNGAYFRHPDPICVAKVIRHYQSSGVHLVFNYKTRYNDCWDATTLKKQWNYTTTYGVDQEGATVTLL